MHAYDLYTERLKGKAATYSVYSGAFLSIQSQAARYGCRIERSRLGSTVDVQD